LFGEETEMKDDQELERIVSEFRTAKIAHSQTLFVEGEGASEASQGYVSAAEKLIENGPRGISVFAKLLEDREKEVRTAAATFLLRTRQKKRWQCFVTLRMDRILPPWLRSWR
jgi:hypothetical protein